MTPATIQLIIGVLEVLLRVVGLLMAVGVVFLFSLHSFAARTVRVPSRESDNPMPLRPILPRPAPFILRSTRPAEGPGRVRGAKLGRPQAA